MQVKTLRGGGSFVHSGACTSLNFQENTEAVDGRGNYRTTEAAHYIQNCHLFRVHVQTRESSAMRSDGH